MRVFLYVRVSTEEQALHGLSIEAQTTALQTWAQEQGHQVAGLYIDAGISARKAASNRPQLQRLLADVRAGRGDLIALPSWIDGSAILPSITRSKKCWSSTTCTGALSTRTTTPLPPRDG